MSAILRRAVPGDVDAICELLHECMNPDFPVERWRTLFTHGWCADEPDLGLVVDDDGRIVGVHCHICSYRTVHGQERRFVNFTSWYIRKEYRKQGFGSKMLAMATADPDTTYTVCSLSPKRIDFFKTLGMTVLEEERLLWRRTGDPYDNLELITDPEEIGRYCDLDDVPVFEDHRDLPVMTVLASTKCTQCLLLLSRAVKNGGVTYFDVLYRSNAALFTERAQHIAEALLPEGDCVLAADRRFVNDNPWGAEVERIRSPRFYKSSKVRPRDIDLAYSEIPLLDLKLD